MTNLYYNFTDPAISGAVVDAIKYNQEMDKITLAFDNFPPAVEFTSGSLNYGAQPGGQPVNFYDIPVTAIPPGTVLKPGNNVAFKVAVVNTGPSQFTVSNIPSRALFMGTAGALVAGDLHMGAIYSPVFDGSSWRTLEMSARYLNVAEGHATAASASAAAASASVAAAANSAASAAAQVTPAANSASTASSQAADATASNTTATSAASTASIAAGNATNSAGGAANSATAAANSADAADTNEALASNAETSATDSATAAAASETAAANSAADAANSAADAADIATDPGTPARIRAALLAVELVVNSVEFFAINTDPNTDYPGTTWVRLPAACSISMSNAPYTDVLTQVGSDTVTLTTAGMPTHTHSLTGFTFGSTTSVATLSDHVPGTVNTGDSITVSANSSVESAHNLTSSGTALSGNVTSTGNHTHSFTIGTGSGGTQLISTRTSTNLITTSTESAGAHTHPVPLPTHDHPFAIPNHSHTFTPPDHTHTIGAPDHTHIIASSSHGHTGSGSLLTVGDGTPFSVVNSNLKLVAWYRTA